MALYLYAVTGSIVALRPSQCDGFVVQTLVEITFMPVDIAKAYFELQQLREEIREAEFALKISFGRPPNRSCHTGLMNARGSQATSPPVPIAKQGQN